MPGTTVIDQLIVKLGLDPRDFTRGEKAAARETIQLENQVKKSSAGMGSSFLGLTSKVLGVATAAIAIKKIIGYTSELSTTIRQLGIDAGNFNTAGSELRNFGNISEMMGGKASDATKTIGGLTKAVYDLAYNGQISDSLIMLARLGVQFQTTTGEARDFRSIVLDTQAAIQKSMAQGTSRANANQMLLQAGFDPGLIQAMLNGDVEKRLARQEQRRQLSGADIKAATGLEESAANRSQAIDAAAVGPMVFGAKGITAANNAGADLLDRATGGGNAGSAVSEFGHIVSEGGAAVKRGISDFLLGLGEMADRVTSKNMAQGRGAYEGTIQAAAKKYGLDPNVLAGLLKTESNFNPGAVNAKSGAVGIAQFMPSTAKSRGFTAGHDPNRDINEAAKYLSELYKAHLKDGNDENAAMYLALQSYNAGLSRVRGATDANPLSQETMDYPEKVFGYASGAMPSPDAQRAAAAGDTNITFEQITIQTPRTDGEGVANEFVGATQRKLSAAQADAGVQ